MKVAETESYRVCKHVIIAQMKTVNTAKMSHVVTLSCKKQKVRNVMMAIIKAVMAVLQSVLWNTVEMEY